MKRLEARIHGRVQRVMMRDFVMRKSRALGLTGTVKNEPDGTVHVIAEGPKEALQTLVGYMHVGSSFANVEKVAVSWYDASHSFRDFRILY